MSRLALASFLLAAAALLVLPVVFEGPPARDGAASVTRLMPHAVLLGFEDGSFTVVPRAGLRADLAAGDSFALPPVVAAGAEGGGTTW